MTKDIIFDKKQKEDGVNKHGHYQFGINRCQYCKGNKVFENTNVCEQCMNYQHKKNVHD